MRPWDAASRPLLLALLLLSGCDAIHRRPTPVGAGDGTAGGGRVRHVEVALFEGGYGIHWHQKVAEKYNAERASDGIHVTVWGDPRIDAKIRPRILRGDPPDLILSGGLPVWRLIAAGKLYPFDSALDRPAYGTNETWRDLFIPGTLDSYVSEGSVYALPTAFGAWSCWYDARLFREHGWSAPRTWSEFDVLCQEIESAGVAPLAFQGKYPLYAWFTYVTLIQRVGGLAAINRINALDLPAFEQEDVVTATRLLQDMAANHFQTGAMAMTHTESQLQFVNRQAAMIYCGIWLENEMKDSIPPGFEMRCFNVPAVEGGKGNPALCNGLGGELIFVPADANYPELALDFARYMVSLENGPDMGRSIGVVSPLKEGTPRESVSPALRSVLDMVDAAPGIFTIRLTNLLLEWTNQVMMPQLDSLLRGETTPEAFCAALDRGIEEALENPDIVIPPDVPYDLAALGEAP